MTFLHVNQQLAVLGVKNKIIYHQRWSPSWFCHNHGAGPVLLLPALGGVVFDNSWVKFFILVINQKKNIQITIISAFDLFFPFFVFTRLLLFSLVASWSCCSCLMVFFLLLVACWFNNCLCWVILCLLQRMFTICSNKVFWTSFCTVHCLIALLVFL